MTRVMCAAVITITLAAACQRAPERFDPQEIVALERGALDRWGRGDPQGYLEIMAPEVTYFDPNLEKRLDGLQAMKDYIAPFTGKIKIDRYELINPTVQRHGDAAVLTFNVVNYRKLPDGTEQPATRWNSTEIYARVDGRWRIIHSHWSYVKPELKQPPSPGSDVGARGLPRPAAPWRIGTPEADVSCPGTYAQVSSTLDHARRIRRGGHHGRAAP